MVINVQLIADARALFVALGIISIGILEWFHPSIAALGFGVPLVAPEDRDFLAIKPSRDIASGAVILTLLTIGDHSAVADTMLARTLIPIRDGLVVFKHAGWIFKPAILIHWGTATLMLIMVEQLRSGM